MNCAILSGYRRVRPFGVSGGAPGEAGENSVRRADGRIERLEGCDDLIALDQRGGLMPLLNAS